MNLRMRKRLSMPGMLATIDEVFETVPDDTVRAKSCRYSMRDCLMTALAMFVFKARSMRNFELNAREGRAWSANLRRLFGIAQAPADETLRQRLDRPAPCGLHRAFTKLFALAQRGRLLDEFRLPSGQYLLAVDGTRTYTSGIISCKRCRVRRTRDGSSFHHDMVVGALVSPAHAWVLLPSAPEMVRNEDGAVRNDCELQAAHRMLQRFRTEHPHLRVVVLLDALYTNAPMIRRLAELRMDFVMVAKRGSARHLMAQVEAAPAVWFKDGRAEGRARGRELQIVEDVALNQASDLRVNVLRTAETRPDGRPSEWTFITSMELTRDSAAVLGDVGRARGRVENHVLDTLKSQTDMNLEHTCGHGCDQLHSNLATLMPRALTLDEIQRMACMAFNAALAARGHPGRLWQTLNARMETFRFQSWLELYDTIANPDRYVASPSRAPPA